MSIIKKIKEITDSKVIAPAPVPEILSETEFIQSMTERVESQDEIDSSLYGKHNVKRGLRNANGTGVIVGLTKVGSVIGYSVNEKKEKVPVEGKLLYRGYSVEDLVNSCIKENRFGFEEVTYLLLFGELPSKDQLNTFKNILGSKRELPVGFVRDSILMNPSKSIMNKLARSVLTLYSYDPDPDNTSVESVLRQSIDLIGYFPALVAYGYQAKRNFYDKESLNLHYPVPELSTAENILRMIRPTGEYTELEAKVLDLCLILHAEHGGGNNSSFTTHLISSSGTDTYSAIAAAIGSLKGPKHGGANIAVIRMINDLKKHVKDITDEAQVEQYLREVLKGNANDGSGLIYGMGHAIYTLSDPRAVVLKDMARRLGEHKGREDDFKLCAMIEEITPRIFREMTGSDKPICANVDLYSGFVYEVLNIPHDVATPLFAVARLSGWCAHRLEELIAGKRLMRPAYVSVQEPQEYVPISERKNPEPDFISTDSKKSEKSGKSVSRKTMNLPKLKDIRAKNKIMD